MRRHRHTPAARRGFTLVELLVAAALTVIVMTVMAIAFQAGMSTLSSLKSVVGLSEQLRTVETVMRNDLSLPHLEDELGTPVRVSDSRLGTPDSPGAKWTNPAPPFGAPVVGPSATAPARRGFLSVVQPSAPTQNVSLAFQAATGYVFNDPKNPAVTYPLAAPPYYPPYWYEGTDPDLESLRATDHVLSMTVKKGGKTAQDGFTAAVPTPPAILAPGLNNNTLSRPDFDPTGAQYFAQWAEVTYFLRPQGTVFTDNADGTITPLPVFSLHRRVRALTPVAVQLRSNDKPTVNGNDLREFYPDLSSREFPFFTTPPNGLPVIGVDKWTNTPADLTLPDRRMPAFVDWHNYAGGAPVRQFRPLPAGVIEVAPGAPLDGTVVNPERYGSDVLLNNVLSMQVRVLVDANVNGLFGPPNPNGTSFVDPPGTPLTWPRAYDTATSPFRIKAVKATIRVWDAKNKQTRQVSIVQDL